MMLPWLILIPVIGGLLCWQSEYISKTAPRWVALITMLPLSGVSISLLWLGDYSLEAAVGGASQWQMEFQMPWIPSLGASIHLGSGWFVTGHGTVNGGPGFSSRLVFVA